MVIARNIGNICFSLSWINMYTFVVFRLYETFKLTQYAMSKKSICIHITIVTIIIILLLIGYVSLHFEYTFGYVV